VIPLPVLDQEKGLEEYLNGVGTSARSFVTQDRLTRQSLTSKYPRKRWIKRHVAVNCIATTKYQRNKGRSCLMDFGTPPILMYKIPTFVVV
jgi:hypothetical protein